MVKKSNKSKIGRRERNQQELQWQERRRHYLQLSVAVMLTVLAVSLAVYIASHIVAEDRFNELDRFIKRIEKAFIAFGEELEPKIAAIEDENTREQLRLPFQLVAINRDNPWRNSQRLIHEAKDIADNEGLIRQTDINFFRYDWLDNLADAVETESLAAAYLPLSRGMGLRRDFDPGNRLDLLILYHELIHVGQDTKERALLETRELYDRYVDFYTAPSRDMLKVIVNYETTAYARELEMLDMLLDGGLRRMVVAGKCDAAAVARALNIRDDQRETVEILCELAGLYFPDGVTSEGLPHAFVRAVAQECAASGYQLYATETSIADAKPVELEDI